MLLAEDNELNREIVVELLSMFNITAVCAVNGREAVERFEADPPGTYALILMDIQMPGINGIDAMKEIRRTNNHTVFIVMSAYDKFDYAKEAIKLGVMEYITKPMEKTRIVNALRKAMENIDAERLKRKNELLIKEKLETVVPIIESGLITIFSCRSISGRISRITVPFWGLRGSMLI
mgnify:CR=1 FL=1